jgi:lipopolysaccharide export system permease protein
VVVNASGGSPMGLLRPVMAAALVVSLLVAVLGHLIAPPAQKAWRFLISDVRADLLATVVREGAFSSLQEGLTFHMRAREPGGILTDIMIADTRDYPHEMIYFAQRGTIVRGEQGAFLSVDDGVIQRRTSLRIRSRQHRLLYFDSYSIDLSFADRRPPPGSSKAIGTLYGSIYSIPTRTMVLSKPARAIHGRIAQPYGSAALPFCLRDDCRAWLGTPHSGRAGRAKRVLAAIGGGGIVLGAQFGASGMIPSAPFTWPVLYLIPLVVVVLGWLAIPGG